VSVGLDGSFESRRTTPDHLHIITHEIHSDGLRIIHKQCIEDATSRRVLYPRREHEEGATKPVSFSPLYLCAHMRPHGQRPCEKEETIDSLAVHHRCYISPITSSPLDLPAIACLTATYHRQETKTFRLERDKVIINDALDQVGIDIFANHNYDTWVLFTILARLYNHSWTDPMAAGLNPLFSLFNHSCDPNVIWATKKDHRTVMMLVSRDAVVGQQLFVEYEGFVHGRPVGERCRRLASWISGPCTGRRCVLEQALLDARRVDEKMSDEQTAEVNCSPYNHSLWKILTKLQD
jgi:hypothetical protein